MKKYFKFLFLILLTANAYSQEPNKEISAQYSLASYYKNLEFERTKLNAELGNADAQFSLASYYEDGKITEKNDSLYAKWLHKSAEQEYIPAYFRLALYYQYDKKDTENAIFWHKKYADAKVVTGLVKYDTTENGIDQLYYALNIYDYLKQHVAIENNEDLFEIGNVFVPLNNYKSLIKFLHYLYISS